MLSKLKEEQAKLRKEIREKTMGYILAALGLVAGLAWNEAIKGFIEIFFPMANGGVIIKFLYAIIVTIFIVIISVYMLAWMQKKEIK